MLKDMDCQRVPVEGNGHGDGGSFLHRLVMRLYGGGGEQAQDAQDVLQEAVLPTEHLSAPSTEQAPAAPQKKAGHSVNTPTNSLLYALWSEWNDIQVGVNAFDYVLNLPLEDGRNGRLCHVCFYQKTKWWHGCFSFRRPAAANQPPWIALSILFAKQASYSG